MSVDWAATQNNLGAAYARLPTGDRAANLETAVDAFKAALRVNTEKDFPVAWAETQTNLGVLYANIPDGNRAENLKSAKASLESALRVYTEERFPNDHRYTAAQLADVERKLSSLTSKYP